jgi:hypothetical protein
VDTVLGAALGYERPRKIRELIERLDAHLCELGGLRHRVANPDSLVGGRPTEEYLLNREQINFLLTRCGLPRADEHCVQIARVFSAMPNTRDFCEFIAETTTPGKSWSGLFQALNEGGEWNTWAHWQIAIHSGRKRPVAPLDRPSPCSRRRP